MLKFNTWVLGAILLLISGCVVPRPPAYAFYDRGYYDDPYYYDIPYARPALYKPYLAGPYYSGSPLRGGLGYFGTYRGRGY